MIGAANARPLPPQQGQGQGQGAGGRAPRGSLASPPLFGVGLSPILPSPCLSRFPGEGSSPASWSSADTSKSGLRKSGRASGEGRASLPGA